MTKTNLALNAEKINKYFNEPVQFQVLQEINLQVEKGKFASIIGKSGCGKSTLMYILSTMDTDYSGRLELNGQVVSGQSINNLAKFRNEHLGFVFQFHFLLPEFSVLQNVMIPALKLGKYHKSEIEDRAYEKLKLVDIQEQALKKASMLSGGQQQRVAIARALINDPAIIMGDEPTGNLDQNNSDNVIDIFMSLAKDNQQTIICVTHDLDIAKRSDMVIEMADGRIV